MTWLIIGIVAFIAVVGISSLIMSGKCEDVGRIP